MCHYQANTDNSRIGEAEVLKLAKLRYLILMALLMLALC